MIRLTRVGFVLEEDPVLVNEAEILFVGTDYDDPNHNTKVVFRDSYNLRVKETVDEIHKLIRGRT